MSKRFSWSAPPLASEDVKLVDAYEKIGKPLDALPYTDDFDDLIKQVDQEPNDANRADLFRRLLTLRKMARLPRSSAVLDIAGERSPLSVEDQELISAYQHIGQPLDALPYTEEFERLIDELGKPKTQSIRHAIFQWLLRLRKRGRLPHASERIR